jgi:hypothetical protein
MKICSFTLCVLMSMTALTPVVAAGRFDDSVRAVMTGASPLKIAEDRGFAVRDGRVQVVALSAVSNTLELEEWLRSRGAIFVLAARGRVQAFVPPTILTELAQRSDVLYVERPLYAELPEPAPAAAPLKQTTLAVTSEGVAAMNVEAWHAEGLTGTGIRVGVMDIQFGGWDVLLGVELPPAGQTTYQAFGGSSVVAGDVHGTACAEIVHDTAPEAELFLAHIRTSTDLFAALDWYVDEGVDVVTMSLGWYGTGPGDGTGRMADEITAFIAAADALFITSAGNERRSHWQGQTVDDNLDDWVDFTTTDDLNALSLSMSEGDRVAVNIVWNDWSSPTSDYSLHLYNLDGAQPEEVAVSNRPQTGESWQTPFEQISYTAPDGGRFGVKINRAGVGGIHDMELFSLDSDLNIRVGEGSLTTPGDARDVVAVAAINYNAPHAYRSFSSAGPANGPGGTFAGGETKPDLSGYDGVSTVSYGTRSFFGTSAASPHAAGAAAVVRNAEPAFDHVETRAFLEIRALDLGASGRDNDYGWGRVFLGQSPGSDCTFSLNPVGATVPASGGGGIIQLATDEGCPWNTSSQAGWLTVAPPSGTGSGVIGYTVDANSGPQRTGQLIIAGLSFVVSQAGSGCSFALNPTSQSFSSAGGDGSFNVQTDAGCGWTATTSDDWITVTAGSASGSGSVLFSVAVNDGATERMGSIVVADQTFTVTQAGAVPGQTTMVAGIAETEGLQQTRWKSDLAILNPGTLAAEIDLVYRHSGGQAQASLSVGPGEIAELVNVAVGTFGAPDSAGAIELQSTTPLIVTARTYNDAPQGTFGQLIPGVTSSNGIAAGEVAALSQLSSNSEVRTNIGFVDLGGNGALVRIRLFNGSGEAVGSQLNEIVPAGGWFQRNRVFRAADAGDCSGCYALIDIAGDEGPIWAYASVVDNDSGDPTTIPMEWIDGAKIAADERYLVAGIAETDGANQTKWKSNLALLNLSGQGITADLIYRHSGGAEQSSVALADGELREFTNVAADLFGAPNSSGAVDVDADGMLVVTARTFNDSPDGTFGQFLPGLGASGALTPRDDGYLSQLKSTDDFRTNIGFTNYGADECTVRIFLHDDQGARKGTLFSTVPAGGWTQVNRVFEASGVGACPLGYAIVEVLTGGCEVWAYASVVDNGSGDPTTVPVVVE